MKNKENAIEFLVGDKYCVCTFTNQRHITKIRKLHESHPEEFEYFIQNEDGSLCAKIPVKWLKISPTRQMSDEQRKAAGERLKKMLEMNKKSKE